MTKELPPGRLAGRSISRFGLHTLPLLSAAVASFWIGASHRTFAAGTFYVEGNNPACSNSGPGTGTAAVPYCSISAAASARGGPGTTLLVKPSVYREQVTVPLSGLPGNPFVIQALGSGVTIDGADDFSIPSRWNPFSGGVWLSAFVVTSPVQVFVDGARLTASALAPASLPPGTFRFISGDGLYVNIGGDSPGTHATFVGKRANGLRLTGRAYVVIDGFNIIRTEDHSVYLLSGANNDTLSHNVVTYAGNSGIVLNGGTLHLVTGNTTAFCQNHGISLQTGTTDSQILGNDSYQNARLSGPAANGIKLDGVSSILVARNRAHNNQDSGIQFNHVQTTNSIQNRSWVNGDHGYDHLDSHTLSHIGDVAYENFRDGISIEGSNSNIHLSDVISVSNGSVTNRFNLWVDSSSTSGFSSDYNILWNSLLQDPIKYGTTQYSSIPSFTAATGHDPHSIQANPQFVNPSIGDFHLLLGSPAIDSADTSVGNYPNEDAEGMGRFDDPQIPNTGTGPVLYADRGALEFSRTCTAETCDGLDNDCDGSVDDGFGVGDGCTVGTGACQSAGTRVCLADHSGSTCNATAGTPSAELCGDAIDNDCDGSTDEGFDVGAACTVGTGACQSSGTKVCTPNGSGTVCDATPGTPTAEICDGIDNDCDGSADDGFDVGSPCTVGTGACQGSGTRVCTLDQLGTSCNAVEGSPTPETCDAIDNDCDGSVDQGDPGGGAQCGSNVGPCTFGTTSCQKGALVCLGAVEPAPELCDTIDNDCDGSVDNNAAPRSAVLTVEQQAGSSHLAWTLPDSPTYDLVRGDLVVLNSSGGDFALATEICLLDDDPTPVYDDAITPSAEQGYWYLVRGSNACGTGSYDSGAASQVGSRDGEIAASAGACP